MYQNVFLSFLPLLVLGVLMREEANKLLLVLKYFFQLFTIRSPTVSAIESFHSMGTSRGGTTSAPSTVNIHLSISFCLRISISGIMQHVKWSRALTQNDFYLHLRVEFNNNRQNINLVTMKQCFNTLKMLSCSRKLQYWWTNSVKFTSYIQMLQGTT